MHLPRHVGDLQQVFANTRELGKWSLGAAASFHLARRVIAQDFFNLLDDGGLSQVQWDFQQQVR